MEENDGNAQQKHEVRLTKWASKQLERVPEYILERFRDWKAKILMSGIRSIRSIPGYHDESLHGDRVGQRSSRLTRAYRVIYKVIDEDTIVVIQVLEVNKHAY